MKLIKTNDGYNLVSEQPQGKLLEATCSEKELKSLTKNHITLGKLSKQNCDELFGVVDVEKLAKKLSPNSSWEKGYVAGFNKAMELNKDKLFTLEDMKQAINMAYHKNDGATCHSLTLLEQEIIQSLQQPTEIEVEIVMKNSRTGKIIKSEADLEWDEDGLCDKAIPKLDSSGNLILKKI